MKYCHKCGKKINIKDKFCKKCGEKVISDNHSKNKTKKIVENNTGKFLEFPHKKSIIQAIFLYIILLIIVVPIYVYFYDIDDSSSVLYFINTIASGVFLVSVAVLQNWKFNSKTIKSLIIGLLLAYLFGIYAGLFVALYILLATNNESTLHKIYIVLIGKIILKGYVYFALGNIITAASYFIADEGDSFYLFYGLTLYGLYLVLKGIYYYFYPSNLEEALKNKLLDNENKSGPKD